MHTNATASSDYASAGPGRKTSSELPNIRPVADEATFAANWCLAFGHKPLGDRCLSCGKDM